MSKDKKNDWDFTDITGEFSLDDDFNILESEDFELVDSYDEELLTPPEETDFEKSVDKSRTEEKEKEKKEDTEQETKKESDEIIEPSTLVEEKLGELERDDFEAGEVEKKTKRSQAKEEGTKEEQQPSKKQAEEKLKPEDESSKEKTKEKAEIKSEDEVSEKTTERKEKRMARQTALKEEELEDILKSLLETSPDFQEASLVSSDGFVLSSVLPEGSEDSRVGAMSAAILSLGERASKELNKGNMKTVFVEGEDGYILVSSVTKDILLVISTTKYAKLGLVFYELKSVREALTELI